MALSKIRSESVATGVIPEAKGKNILINGGMTINQRGSSSTANGYGSVDRWKLTYGGGGTLTQSQQSLSSSDTPYAKGFRNSLRATVTSASNAAGTYAQIEQPIEAQNIVRSGWEYTNSNSSLTFSFWAKSSLAGTYYVQFRTFDGTSYYYNKSFTLSANAWKKIICTVAGNSNLTINNDNGEGFRVVVVPDYGTTYTGHSEAVTDAWYTRTQADGYFPNFAQDWHNTASATFEITGVQLEVGDVASPVFEHEDFGTTLAKCQRYLYRRDLTIYDTPVQGHVLGQKGSYVLHLPVSLRITPACSQGSGIYTWYNQAGSITTQTNLTVFYMNASTANASSVFIRADDNSTLSSNDFPIALLAYDGSNSSMTSFIQLDAEL
tara:strand:- start:469 stop:1605 length:1137 start_codon:yes stop_codon:yes gene_type:complete